MKNGFKVALSYIILIAVILLVAASLFGSSAEENLVYSDIVALFKEERVKEFKIDENNVLTLIARATADNGTESEVKVKYFVRDINMFSRDLGDIINEQADAGIIESYDYPVPDPFWGYLSAWLPVILFIGVMVFLGIYFMKRMSSGSGGGINPVGRMKAKLVSPDKTNVFFKDVAGADEEKAELEEIVEFLRNPAYFTKLGAKIPHGVLLVGPPGTGKTLIAKAVAGEAGVPFYSISGSDFVELYVGVGAARVRDLFETARKNPAAIIFIDEIDAIGRHRGTGLGGGHDEREQTLNQILVEMDGFATNNGVIVMGATNRPDILDPALLRPGRFDRQVTMTYPDVKGREEILKVHSKNKPYEADVDLSVIAKTTVGFTGAELSNLLNEAALLAARKGKNLIGMNDIEEALIKVIVGPSKRSRIIKEKDKRITAYHEAGHAITGYVKCEHESIHQISIIPAGRAAGYTLDFPKDDHAHMSRSMMNNEILYLLGGRAAEELMVGDISTGASNDIERASGIARQMVTKYGMSDKLGPILYGSEASSDEVFLGRDFNQTQNYSDSTAAVIDSEVKDIVSRAYDGAKAVLTEYRAKLEFIADFLVKYEIMEEEQFRRAMTEDDVTLEMLDAMTAEKRRKSQLENEAYAKRQAQLEKEREEERKKNERTFRPHEPNQFRDRPDSRPNDDGGNGENK